ncbi:MAG TPA: hypothetical protein PLP17_16915, partial [Oligoflexia bacterium]|nr:hypothetical protein [Oligoflexia bacterium]
MVFSWVLLRLKSSCQGMGLGAWGLAFILHADYSYGQERGNSFAFVAGVFLRGKLWKSQSNTAVSETTIQRP